IFALTEKQVHFLSNWNLFVPETNPLNYLNETIQFSQISKFKKFFLWLYIYAVPYLTLVLYLGVLSIWIYFIFFAA
ncbi:hypothetical protein, partial [Mycoplasmopsis alligatoris]|uniref:hypothetical protein n=1 Tax=Mycoplasmopsis alligatoris TaxID=47687 RepID=UPI00058C72BA